MVVLHEVLVDAELRVLVAAVGLHEEAAVVAVHGGLDQDRAVEPLSRRFTAV